MQPTSPCRVRSARPHGQGREGSLIGRSPRRRVRHGPGDLGGCADADVRRLPVPPRFAVVGSGTQTWDDSWFCCSVEGRIGLEVVTAEVRDSYGVAQRRLDSPLGLFVAATGDQAGAIVVLRD